MSHPPVIITRPSHHLIITSGGLHLHYLIITWAYSRTGAAQDWCGVLLPDKGGRKKVEKVSPAGT